MLKKLSLILFFPILLFGQEVQNIVTLFDSLKTHPVSRADEINLELSETGKSMAVSHLFPNIDLFGKYDYSSTATGMLPLPLNEMFTMIKDPSLTQPFSENIYRIGASISMPIFVKSIYSMISKASMMNKSAEDKKFINLLKNEAMVVSLNANIAYMDALEKSLEQKKNSLLKTKEFVTIKVNNGRAPESSLLKINNGLNEIDVMKNDISLQREEVLAAIRNLTGVSLKNAIPMIQSGTYQDGEMKALDPLKEKLEADRLGYRAEIEKLFPMLVLQGNYNRSFAKAYNNDKDIAKNYYTIGLVLKIPLLAMDQYAQIGKSSVDVRASENELDKMSLELSSQAGQLQNSLPLIENSIQLYSNSIKDKEELLKIAKVSYQSDQPSLPILVRQKIILIKQHL